MLKRFISKFFGVCIHFRFGHISFLLKWKKISTILTTTDNVHAYHLALCSGLETSQRWMDSYLLFYVQLVLVPFSQCDGGRNSCHLSWGFSWEPGTMGIYLGCFGERQVTLHDNHNWKLERHWKERTGRVKGKSDRGLRIWDDFWSQGDLSIF